MAPALTPVRISPCANMPAFSLPPRLTTRMRTLAERDSASTAGLISTTLPSKLTPG